jgi:hypothetical protein|tara:strand:+ start:2894 stop:3145 length:252 start_codon:yes stop_codon:yes gene_type:complete
LDNLTNFQCDACDKSTQHDSTKRHIPFGWCNRNIEDTVFILCESCGVEGAVAPDISPSLCEKFARKGVYFKGCEQWGIKKVDV